jgi:mitochondrial-processing peptidase subunit alpha
MAHNITPSKCLIVGAGIQNHSEFVDLCVQKLNGITLQESIYERQKSIYTGGETRIQSETPSTSISLAFESVPWTHLDQPAYFLMRTIIGSATGFSSGGPGKGMYCRAVTSLM